MQCEAGRFHQNVAQCHVDFQPLAARHGGPRLGRILVSTFHNPWRALIRFDTGDLVKLAAKPCPCGRDEGLTLDAIEGRVGNATLSSAGRLITHSEVDSRIALVDGVEQYELVQREPTTISVRYVSDSRPPAALEPELCGALRECYGASVKVSLVQVSATSPVLGVKYRLTSADFEIDIRDYLAEEP
jgi:phenylacetate-coenzyme A ligase PaaK-like adenylate-forming protein